MPKPIAKPLWWRNFLVYWVPVKKNIAHLVIFHVAALSETPWPPPDNLHRYLETCVFYFHRIHCLSPWGKPWSVLTRNRVMNLCCLDNRRLPCPTCHRFLYNPNIDKSPDKSLALLSVHEVSKQILKISTFPFDDSTSIHL